jgi:hypothetical protein
MADSRHLTVTTALQCWVRSSSSDLARQRPTKSYLMTRTSEPLLALSSVTELLWTFTTQT